MRRFPFWLCRPVASDASNIRILNSKKDTVDSIYPALRSGKKVLVKESLELAFKYQHCLVELCQLEYPAVDVYSLVHQQQVVCDLNKNLLIDRDLEIFPDYIDAVNNTTFSAHLQYFEETHWNKSIGREMLQYAEKIYPKISHEHLSVSAYLSLIDSFAASRNGVSYPNLLGKMRLHPSFGVHVPKAVHVQHYKLFLTWFRTMREPLMMKKVMMLGTGLGILPLAVSRNNIQGILCTDKNPHAIESLITDIQKLDVREFTHKIVCQNAALFPKVDTSKVKFDCVVYSPDFLRFSTYEIHETPYAPGLSGIDGEFESFFENAESYMRDWGVAVIVMTNFRTLIEPTRPHPVEYEVKHNRRWVVLDYYEAPIKGVGDDKIIDNTPEFIRRVRASLKAEVWILHTISSIGQFGFMHGVPNAHPPDAIRDIWGKRKLRTYQNRVIRECAQSLDTTVKHIKARLSSELSNSDVDYDNEAEYIHMKLDPANFLKNVKAKQQERLQERETMRANYEREVEGRYSSGLSPREAFDTKWDTTHRLLSSGSIEKEDSATVEEQNPDTSQSL